MLIRYILIYYYNAVDIQILYVIVLYNQRLQDCNTYKTLLLDNLVGNALFIFDNSPIPQHEAYEFEGLNVKYISARLNPGLSFAYNRAADYAKECGYEWILILDQDTKFPSGIILEYSRAISENQDVKLFAPRIYSNETTIMSPLKDNLYFNIKSVDLYNRRLDSRKYSVINSGMVVNVDAMLSVWGYDEGVWLDYSDIEFVERFSRKYDSFYVIESICHQEFSNDIQSIEQKLCRYRYFCNCIKAIPKESFTRQVCYALLILKRAISLTRQSLNLTPLRVSISEYFK